MPNYYVNFLFTDEHLRGWSENYYLVRANIEDALAGAVSDGFARLRILAVGNHMDEVRVSDTAILRDSLVKQYAGDEGNGTYATGGGIGEQEHAPDRLLLRMEAGSLARRTLELGGIPGGITDQFFKYSPTPKWIRLFGQWVNNLLAPTGPAHLRRQSGKSPLIPDAIGAPANPAGSFNLDMVSADIAGWAVDNVVRLSRFRNTRNIEGKWTILSITPNTPTPTFSRVLLKPRRRPPIFASTSQIGVVSNLTLGVATYQPITTIQPVRGVIRRTGRPFDSARGLRPTRP